MTRRAATRGDPSIREAILAKREHLGAFLTTPQAQERTEAIRNGAPVTVSTALLGGALALAGHPLASAFTFAADRDNTRTWLLDAHDVLTEITDRQEGTTP